MFTNLRDAYALIALVALLPGAVSWWSGRRLARRVDDPALPELFAAHGRRTRGMLFVSIVTITLLASWAALALAIPILFAGIIAAAYPLRRALYHETWSFGSYLSFYPRVMAGLFGFLIVLALLPTLVGAAGKWDWLAGAVLAGVLVLWHTYSADVVRSCLRTRPIAEGEFLSRCRALADACGVPQPRFECIDLGGGVIANAVALPSLRTASVIFTDTLLERLDEPERLAICAHELAHFEHYNPGYLRRWNRVTYLLIALGAAAAPITRITGLESTLLPTLLWFAAIVVSAVLRARDKQRQETVCDLRAVELTGDAEAMIRGLTKLYTIARVPRRIEQQTERAATHPSLARRIRDIRKAAGVAPATLGAAQTFTSADGHTVVIFDDVELRWAERDGATHSISYAHVTDLRVDARARRGSRLVALGAGARRWEMSLADSDVGRLQGVLDVVDGRLADPPRPPFVHPNIQRIVVLTAAAMILTLSHVAVAFVALLALLKPSLPLLLGAGLAALTAAGLVARDYAGTGYVTLASLPMAVTGLLLLAFAWGHRHDARQRTRPFIAALAVAAAAAVTALAFNGVDVIRLHQSARTIPSATVLLVALAGALACSTSRRVRLAATAVGVAALATTFAASTIFLDGFATDPFLVDAPALEWVSVEADAVEEFDVPLDTSRIDLSPNGRYVAVYQNSDSDEGHASAFLVGPTGQALASIAADGVAFVDDEQLLIVQSDSHGTTLKSLRLNPSLDVAWQHSVDDLFAPSLSFDRATGGWRLMGLGDDGSMTRVDGVIGTSEVRQKRWPAAYTRGLDIQALTTSGPDMLVVETEYDRGPLTNVIPRRWTLAYMLQPFNQVSRYATVGDRGRRTFGESRLDVDCLADVLPGGALACTAYDGIRTHLVSIDGGTGHVVGLGLLDGHFLTDRHVVRGWLTGWVASRAVAIRLSTGEVLHLPRRAGATSVLSVANDRLAAVMMGDGHFTVRLYPLPPETPAVDGMRAQRARD